uniref:Uncharacterized protein n=1 Tax=Arundo donax TaxID=35708 RepID=A0A0A9DM62_ARUDO
MSQYSDGLLVIQCQSPPPLYQQLMQQTTDNVTCHTRYKSTSKVFSVFGISMNIERSPFSKGKEKMMGDQSSTQPPLPGHGPGNKDRDAKDNKE